MKIKHLILVSLLLAVLTIGAVSASEDIVSDDTLTVDDEGVDLEETSGDDVVSNDGDPDDLGDPEDEGDPEEDPSLEVYYEVDTDLNEESSVASVRDYYHFGGVVTLSIDNTQYFKKNVTIKDQDESEAFNINFKDLNLPVTFSGKHNVVLTYLKNTNSKTYTAQGTVEFKFFPEVNCADDFAVGELAVIGIKALPGSSGTATIYNYDAGNKGSAVQTISISGGSGTFVLAGLAKGDHSYIIDITVNGQQFIDYGHSYFTVRDNTPGFSSSISANVINVGNSVVVSLNGPKSNGNAYVYVDGKQIKSVSFAGGSITELIASSLLPAGKHYVTVQTMTYGEDDITSFYSNTFEVTVNAPAPASAPAKKVNNIKLTLKKVTVKKSAKKLVLKATLKINGKKVKGKKLTFKFNGKTYKAKTNKKGVAKVTIKKNVLKKLKVGKKVKYQVSYGGKTVKKTAKVKK